MRRAELLQLHGRLAGRTDEAHRARERLSDPPGQPAVPRRVLPAPRSSTGCGATSPEAEERIGKPADPGRRPQPGPGAAAAGARRVDAALERHRVVRWTKRTSDACGLGVLDPARRDRCSRRTTLWSDRAIAVSWPRLPRRSLGPVPARGRAALAGRLRLAEGRCCGRLASLRAAARPGGTSTRRMRRRARPGARRTRACRELGRPRQRAAGVRGGRRALRAARCGAGPPRPGNRSRLGRPRQAWRRARPRASWSPHGAIATGTTNRVIANRAPHQREDRRPPSEQHLRQIEPVQPRRRHRLCVPAPPWWHYVELPIRPLSPRLRIPPEAKCSRQCLQLEASTHGRNG